MPYFVNSTSLVTKSVFRRFNRVNFRVEVNLGQSSCYLDLRSNFHLTFRGQKVYVSMRLEEKNTMVLKLFRYLSWFESYLRKTMHPQIVFFFLLWTALDWSRYDLKRSTRVSLDSERRNSWAARQCLHEMPSNRADARGFNIQPVIGQCRKGKFTSLQFERFSVLRCIDVVNLIPTRRLLEEAGYVWPAHVASGG